MILRCAKFVEVEQHLKLLLDEEHVGLRKN